ncbi:MAG: Hsp20/alpha crystallin family protein [Candidatus Obscuribacter sp.]|nr:Hsp20/alpha crystallin family protein [Candidatus Obscuribacter sp.]
MFWLGLVANWTYLKEITSNVLQQQGIQHPWRNHLNRSYYGYGYEATTLQNQGWDIPSADVLELDDQFILELALPGVVLDDIEVKVEENFLTVTASAHQLCSKTVQHTCAKNFLQP